MEEETVSLQLNLQRTKVSTKSVVDRVEAVEISTTKKLEEESVTERYIWPESVPWPPPPSAPPPSVAKSDADCDEKCLRQAISAEVASDGLAQCKIHNSRRLPYPNIAAQTPLDELGDVHRVKLVYCVSQLEFYVIREVDLQALRKLEDQLDRVGELLRTRDPLHPIVESGVCAVFYAEKWWRARISTVGGVEAHVFLIDYGRYQFVPTRNLRAIPSKFAELCAPPFVHLCSLKDADSRYMDDKSVRQFSTKMVKSRMLDLRSCGRIATRCSTLVAIEQIHLPSAADEESILISNAPSLAIFEVAGEEEREASQNQSNEV